MKFCSNLAFYETLYCDLRDMSPFEFSANFLHCCCSTLCYLSDFGNNCASQIDFNLAYFRFHLSSSMSYLRSFDNATLRYSYRSRRAFIFDWFSWILSRGFDMRNFVGLSDWLSFLIDNNRLPDNPLPCLSDDDLQEIKSIYLMYHNKI